VERRIELLNGIENARKAHQFNPLFILALAIIGSQWGRSEIARLKNNLFGWGALVSHTFEGAGLLEVTKNVVKFSSGKLKTYILPQTVAFFKGTTLKDINVHYSSDKRWAAEVRDIMNDMMLLSTVRVSFRHPHRHQF
jgi:beta-N-acetylglucosaminidase